MNYSYFKGTLFILIFIAVTYPIVAQSYLTNLTSYSVEDGLSNRFVNAFFEDSKGFVWLATQNGINRFDGHRFEFFMKQSKKFSSSNCITIAEDINGRIWPGFLDVKNPHRRIYQHYIDEYLNVLPIDDILPDTLNFTAKDIYQVEPDENNHIYIFTYDGTMYKYDGQFKIIAQHLDVIDKSVVIGRNSGHIYLINKKYIEVINQQGILVEKDSTFLEAMYFGDEAKSACYKTAIAHIMDSNSLAALSKEIKRLIRQLNPKSERVKKFSIEYLCKDGNCYYIIQADDFIGLYDEDLELIFDFGPALKEKYKQVLYSNSYLIRKNQLWVCNQNGFCVINYQKNRFKQYFNNKSSYSTRGILERSNGNILTLSYKGVKEINRQSDEIKIWPTNSTVPFRGAIELEDNSYIFGSYAAEIYHFNPITEEGHFISLKEDTEKKLAYKGFLIPFQDSNKTIWVTSYNGLLTYNPQIDALEIFDKYNQYSSLKQENISYFQEEQEGIWMASSDGLFLMDTVRGIKAHYPILSNLNVHHFYREGDIFWLATQKGLVKWNIKTKEHHQYNISNGMLDDYLMAVYPDTMGNLWMTSEMGLIRFNKETTNIYTFLESDGITHNEFNKTSHFQAADGQLYFGGLNGITAFYPTDVEVRPKTKAALSITEYYEFDEEYGDFLNKTSQMLENNKIVLTPQHKSFKLYFTLLTYQNTQQIRYSYKLEELDKSWIIQKENNVRFSQLPYGHYTLKIKAQNYTGEEVESNLSIPVEVLAPFYYQRRWQFFGILLLGLFIYLYVKRRLRAIELDKKKLENLVQKRTATIAFQNQQLLQLNQIQENQKEELERINKTKDRLFAILAHDLRPPLHSFKSLSNHVNYLLQKNDKNRLDILMKYLEKEAGQLYHLLDNLLHWALAQRGELSIESEILELHKIVENVLVHHRPLASRLGVELLNEVATETLLKADKRILETVFRNLISNALRYTSKDTGWIKIAAFDRNDIIHIEVSDNGRGMTPEKLNTLFNLTTTRSNISLGLHLCKEMITLLDGNIAADSQVNQGTTFTITLPSEKLIEQHM